MKYETIAKIMFPLALVMFVPTFVRFCVRAFLVRNWVLLIMGISPTLALLIFFVGLYVTVKKKLPITELQALQALAFYLVIAAGVLFVATPL